MNVFGKGKKFAGEYTCPICGKTYRHAGMAERCTRTRACRLYNIPPRATRDTWRLLGGAAYLGGFFVNPLTRNGLDLGKDTHDAAQAVDAAGRAVFAYLHTYCPVAEHVRIDLHRKIMREAAGIWPPGKEAFLAHVGDVAMAIIFDAAFEAKRLGLHEKGIEKVQGLSDAMERVYALLFPEGGEDYDADALEAIDRLEKVLIGQRPAQRPPSLYVVNERLLVVARGRAEVRRAVLDFGLARPRIHGVASGEKFADGRTAADIIALATTIPSHIGRLEE